jgi:hypothetical protein
MTGRAQNFDDHRAVDRVAGRLADERIVEGRLRAAEPEIFVLDRDDAADGDLVVALERSHLFRFQTLDDRGLAVEQGQHACRAVADEIEVDAGNLRLTFEVAIRIGFEDRGIAFLLDELERPGAVQALRQRPGRAARRHRWPT